MGHADRMTERNTWPRNRSTLPGGGLSTLPGGGLSTLPGDGLSSLPGGGLYDGADPNPYRSNQPPMTHFIPYLRHQGLNDVADLLARAHGLNL